MEQGTIIKCDPAVSTVGHEQQGYRPLLVISNEGFNSATGFAHVAEITNTSRNFPTRVKLPSGLKVKGDILTDQVRSIDLSARNPQIVDYCPQDILDRVLDMVKLAL